MTAHAIIRYWGGAGDIGIDLDRGGMTMDMAVKVGAMALGAGAAFAKVDGGVAMAVDTHPAGAVDRIVAGGARGVDSGDGVAGMATDAERCRRYRGVMAVGMAVEVEGVTLGAVFATLNDGACWWSYECWRHGMAIGAAVLVDRHRIVGLMAKRYAGR